MPEISSVAVTGASRIVREARVGGKPMDPTTFVVDEIGRFAFTPLQLGLGLFCRFYKLPEVIHMSE